MKKLLIIRHAKSDWNNAGIQDFDRPLNTRGQRNAPEMAYRLLKKRIIPQLIVSSPAMRAISTAVIFSEILGLDKKDIRQKQGIYESSSSSLLNVINGFDNQYEFITLVGHNPGLTDLVLKLCDCDIYNIPTCGVVVVNFPFSDWRMISKGTGSLELYDYPKNSPTH